MKDNTMYIGTRKIYETTNAKVIGIPREILKQLSEELKEVKISYDFEKKCMKVFFD